MSFAEVQHEKCPLFYLLLWWWKGAAGCNCILLYWRSLFLWAQAEVCSRRVRFQLDAVLTFPVLLGKRSFILRSLKKRQKFICFRKEIWGGQKWTWTWTSLVVCCLYLLLVWTVHPPKIDELVLWVMWKILARVPAALQSSLHLSSGRGKRLQITKLRNLWVCMHGALCTVKFCFYGRKEVLALNIQS